MRITDRDMKLVTDLALSHVLSRDQILELGYFSSVCRVNARLLELAESKLVRRLETPFFHQSLYCAGSLAQEVVGMQVSRLLEHRLGSPRFVRHALSVTSVRITLCRKGSEWRFEQQLWREIESPKKMEIRPDGLLITSSLPIFVEVDLGHVALNKFKEKVLGYQALSQCSQCRDLYGFDHFRLLTITTGSLRARHLHQALPQRPGFEFLCQTFEEIGARPIPNWS